MQGWKTLLFFACVESCLWNSYPINEGERRISVSEMPKGGGGSLYLYATLRCNFDGWPILTICP